MTADAPLPPGTVVGRYRIEQPLALGGPDGPVYLAHDTASHRRVCLLEFLPPGIAQRIDPQRGGAAPPCTVVPIDSDFKPLFAAGIAEVQALAFDFRAFRHANVLAVLDCFAANNTVYLAVDLPEGRRLDRLLRPGEALSPEELDEILPSLLAGAEAIHRGGLLHLDICPGAIMIRHDATAALGRAHLVRRTLGAPDRGAALAPRDAYRAEEYFQPGGKLGPWTDIYALAATLFRAVTGKPPHDALSRRRAIAGGGTDPVGDALDAAAGAWPQPMLAAIRLGIAIPAGHRPQSVAAFRAALGAAGLGEIPTLPLRERAGDAPTRPYFPPQKAKEPDTIRPPVAAPMPRRALSETVRRIAPTGDSARGDAGDGRTRPLPARPLPAPPVPARARSVPAASPPTAEPPPAAAPDDIPTVRIGPTARMGREAPPVLPPDPAAEVSAADGGAPGNAAQDHGAQDHGAPDRGAWGSAAEGLGPPVVAPPPPLPNLPTGDDKKTTVIYRRGRAEVVTAPVKPSRPEPPATDAEAAILPARFSVFHPMMLAPGQWHDAAVYLHEPGIDSFVRRDHMARFEGGAGETPEPRSALRYTLKPGAAVTVVPYLPGCRTNPPRATVEWWENFHRVTFRVMANAAVPGFAEGPAQGAILFFAGPLLVGEARLPYVVGREKAHPISNTAALAADTFDAVFPAYAPQDGEIADRLQALQGQVDSPYLAEMLALRAQDWDREILKRIEAAERFQLFWSPAAVRSPHLEEEWRFAHALGRDHFIRAFHWRHPAPGLPAVLGEAGVPLRHLALGLE